MVTVHIVGTRQRGRLVGESAVVTRVSEEISPVGENHSQGQQQTTVSNAKALQSLKLRDVGEALVSAGFVSLAEQARALALPQSTTWTILVGTHKASGLSADIVNRILRSPELPDSARTQILEYVAAKAAGVYGHSRTRARRFIDRVLIPHHTLVSSLTPARPQLVPGDSDGRQHLVSRAVASDRPRRGRRFQVRPSP
jgi:hypothetical protein